MSRGLGDVYKRQHINRMHKTEGVNFVNPSEILAKLLEAIPKEIPIAKNK